jgi:glucokinase
MLGTSGEESLVVGVDVGGTKVTAGTVNRSGEILNQLRVPMVSHDGAALGMAAVISVINSVVAKATNRPPTSGLIRGIGICSPGPLDPNAGVIINPPNLPCWRNFPLAAEVSRIYRVPVKLDNDANAAALAETLWGAGRGYRNVFLATIGTGIGTGIVLDGRIYHGRTGAAAEGGHLSIDYRGPRCQCGKRGCIEVFASGPAIARRARARLATEPRGSCMLDRADGNLDAVTSETVAEACSAGDPLAASILQETLGFLSVWLGNIVDLLEPEVVILGGGVATMLRPFFDEIHNRLPDCCVNSRCQEIPLLPACFGGDAGMIGAAALFSQPLETV